MAMENAPVCSDFQIIMADLESENMVANVAATNHVLTLIAGGKLPEPLLLCRLITALASNLAKPRNNIFAKRAIHSTLKAIRVAIISNRMNMDSLTCGEALRAIRGCLLDEALRRIQNRASMVRLWTVQEQLKAVRIIHTSLRRSPVNINNKRCITAFASLMLSRHTTVVRACKDSLLSLSPVVAGFAFAVTRAYCNLLIALPPQSSLRISCVVVMLHRLKRISMTMVDQLGFDDLAMDVLQALANRNLTVRKEVLNLAVSLLTPRNINDVVWFMKKELDMAATSHMPFEYHQMLEEAIRECLSSYPESIMQFILDPKYLAFIDGIDYLKDIMDHNPLLRAELLKGLLKALRHVRSSPICAAAVWAISICSESLLEIRTTIFVISFLFEGLLNRRELEKQILGSGEVQHDNMLPTDYYGVKEGGAWGEHQQPWLMDMEELLFVHTGLTRQADGSYAIASSSQGSANAQGGSLFMLSCLEHTDNLELLVQCGDGLLADFVNDMLSWLSEKVNE